MLEEELEVLELESRLDDEEKPKLELEELELYSKLDDELLDISN